eukprot:533852-Amphidinium_carterae.1
MLLDKLDVCANTMHSKAVANYCDIEVHDVRSPAGEQLLHLTPSGLVGDLSVLLHRSLLAPFCLNRLAGCLKEVGCGVYTDRKGGG